MKTLYIERSCGGGRDGHWTEELDLEGVERIVVGTGPGSFAGIRAALAFAQGFALGRPCEVLGLPSPCAVAAQHLGSVPSSVGSVPDGRLAPSARDKGRLAVVGDARRGKIWIALFEGYSLVRDVFHVNSDEILGSVPNGWPVVTVDEARIGEKLKAAFGERYLGGQTPTAEGLRAFAEANPDALVREPRPIYLNPAVRD
jgi:tRNA threonylcarbamoyl adenosine modification protein YeaZ